LEDNEARTVAILDRLPIVPLRQLTDDEKAQLSSGEITENEAAALMISAPEPVGDETDTPTEKPPTEVEQKVSEQIARIYVLRDVMTSKIEGLLARAKAEYDALPAEERTNAKKQELGMKYLSEADTLESGCDAQMEALLKDLTNILKDYGGDTGIISEIRQAYKDEKITKKSYYLSKYM
jgi:hypothetical protein